MTWLVLNNWAPSAKVLNVYETGEFVYISCKETEYIMDTLISNNVVIKALKVVTKISGTKTQGQDFLHNGKMSLAPISMIATDNANLPNPLLYSTTKLPWL